VTQPFESTTHADISRSTSLPATRLLFQEAPKWIHRSVHKYHFVDLTTLRGTASIDFTVPPFGEPPSDADNDPVETQLLYVPLAFAPTQKLADVSLRDEGQRSIPALNIDSERELTAFMLLNAWADLLGKPVDQLQDVARETNILLNGNGGPEARHAVARLDSIAQTQVKDGAEASWIISQSRLFLGGAIIYGVLQDALPGQRRILKISYLTPAPLKATFRLAGERLGLLATQLLLPDLPVANCRSYHLELLAPEGMRFQSALLEAIGQRVETLDRLDDTATARAHLYVADRAKTPESPSVYARFAMRADNGPWLRYAFLMGILASGLILLTGSLMETIKAEGSGGFVGGGLVVLTAIPPLFLARPSIHPIGAQLLAGVRIALILLSTLATLVAWELLANPTLTPARGHAAGLDMFRWRWRIAFAMIGLTAYIGLNFVPWLRLSATRRLADVGRKSKQWRDKYRLRRARAAHSGSRVTRF
jgi:hypothetical protein